jgi:hypothetical protein
MTEIELKLDQCKDKLEYLADWEVVFLDTFYWFDGERSFLSESIIDAIWNKITHD